MAEEVQHTDVAVETREQASEPEATETDVKTFTQEELDSIIQKEKAKAKRAAEKEYQAKMDEAEKLRKMNADEKARYEAEKKDARIAELEAQVNRQGLEREATKMLSEQGIPVTEAILTFVVREDAETTKEAVTALSEMVEEAATLKAKELLKGKTPRRAEASTDGGITKEQFNRMSYTQKNELYHTNPELYAQLKG